ncbi:hypothetical protein PHLGIDRAFT_437869 [Phlebiopsis gigantea 11061_1 CR5-6]|uniref:Cleavage stimulation factor subunit 2 hinge domain-containing protein n=1 Tax=Phlebiopsis gigantea (strain 11061_1 CR5-6) TaxID=745531 RepID=A0A0C3S686_PHLG1|nr:hypothetical protein PHLGIDRAFT_437869 [Phlebiopsis gigantea 11061_1 CR5-6]
MASNPAVQEEQLLELLLQLKKTTPEQAKVILNAQPQIAYALMAVMVNLNAINMEVTQRTVASFGAGAAFQPPAGPSAPPSAPAAMQFPAPHMPVQPMPAIPPHLNNQPAPRGNTPSYARGPTPTYPSSSAPPQYPRGGAPGYPPPGPAYPPGQGYPPQNVPPQHMPPQNVAPPSMPAHMRQQYGGPPPQPGGYGGPPPPHSAPPHSAPPNPAPAALPDAFANIPEDQKAVIMRVIQMTPEQIAQLPPQERSTMIQLRQTLGLPA